MHIVIPKATSKKLPQRDKIRVPIGRLKWNTKTHRDNQKEEKENEIQKTQTEYNELLKFNHFHSSIKRFVPPLKGKDLQNG